MAVHLEPGATLNQYRILGLIGRGGMGEVYAADDTRLGRKVAIKILPATLADDAERLRRFTQEARAVSALNHPSILTIYDVDEVGGHPFLVTEFIAGDTLRARMRRGTLEVREAVEIAYQVAGALSAAHAAGVVHRDVKPETSCFATTGREAPGFRPGENRAGCRGQHGRDDRGRRTPDDSGSRDGDHGVHVAGAGARSSRRCQERHLQSRRRAVRDGRRPAAVSGRDAE
jgi:hypothetical protein